MTTDPNRTPAAETDPRAWLENDRKLGSDLLDAMGVRTVRHPALGQAVAFPYQRPGDSGRAGYAAKFRGLPKQWASSKGVSRGLYNEPDLHRLFDLPVVICEGEIDALSCMQAGWERAISVPDGWGKDASKAKVLHDAEAALRRSPYVIVAADADEAGESMPRAVATLLAGHDVREARWPEGCKDANDVLVQYGEGELSRCLNDARRIDPPGGTITGLADLPPMSERRVLRTGIRGFDRVIAFECSALSIWTGTPGSGKSTFLTWAAHEVAWNEDIRVGILAFETHPHALRDQLSLIRGGVTWHGMHDEDQARFLAALDPKFRIVHRRFNDGTVHRIEWLEEMIRTLVLRDGCKLIVVDPWNELEHLPAPGESMTAYINWALQRMRQIAEELEVHVALVAHPRKMPTDGSGRAPTGYDIADSAAFFNKPSLGVTVHRAEDEDGSEYVQVKAWKVRDTRLYRFGRGSIRATFDEMRASYAWKPMATSEA